MANSVHVRLTGRLRRFIEDRAGPDRLYKNASEYIRDLVCGDFEREEQRRWEWLAIELSAGLAASDDEFELVETEALIAEARTAEDQAR